MEAWTFGDYFVNGAVWVVLVAWLCWAVVVLSDVIMGLAWFLLGLDNEDAPDILQTNWLKILQCKFLNFFEFDEDYAPWDLADYEHTRPESVFKHHAQAFLAHSLLGITGGLIVGFVVAMFFTASLPLLILSCVVGGALGVRLLANTTWKHRAKIGKLQSRVTTLEEK